MGWSEPLAGTIHKMQTLRQWYEILSLPIPDNNVINFPLILCKFILPTGTLKSINNLFLSNTKPCIAIIRYLHYDVD